MRLYHIFVIGLAFYLVVSLPVDPKKKEEEQVENKLNEEDEKKVNKELDDLGLEYGRYLQEVVAALEEDKEFAKKLENVTADHIKSGVIAKELDFVNHNVRSKLDELKRIEMDRLRKLAKREHDANELGEYNSDGRRWRTLRGADVGTGVLNNFEHVDGKNPHYFEVDDLHKLIVTATKDLEILDKRRREEFKTYEMEKEFAYNESLKNMTDDQKKEVVNKHDDMIKKHKDHPKVHHPGSKQQFEEVWEEKDHMPKEEFNPKVFFSMHDINGDGYLDPQEVEALLSLEIRKMYDPNNPEDDPNEMMEEYHRMREHIYKEADKNRDGLISRKEFLEMTEKAEFTKDEGWQALDEKPVYSQQEYMEYERRRHEQMMLQQQQYGQYYGHPQQGYQQGYGMGPGHPQQVMYQQQQMHPQQMQQHPQQMQQHPQQMQQHPQQIQQHPQQMQQYPQQGQQQQLHPQQAQQLHPQYQQIEAGNSQHQGNANQQYQQAPHQVQFDPNQHLAGNHPQMQQQQFGQPAGVHAGGIPNGGVHPAQMNAGQAYGGGSSQPIVSNQQGVPSPHQASAINNANAPQGSVQNQANQQAHQQSPGSFQNPPNPVH